MSFALPYLQQLGITRDILKNREVTLLSVTGGQTYSADLSLATERIGHKLAQSVWRTWTTSIDAPKWVVDAGVRILGPKRLRSGEITSQSVHMGLGISWIVLSLINGGCALWARIPRHSFAICGDDLAAHATPIMMRQYAANLNKLRLVNNTAKEFVSEHGVFCEKMMLNLGDVVVSVNITQLSELGATKLRGNFSRNHIDTLTALTHSKPKFKETRRLLGKTLKKLRIKGVGRGPIDCGGDGMSKVPTVKQTKRLLKHGFCSTNPGQRQYSGRLRASYEEFVVLAPKRKSIEDGDVIMIDDAIICNMRDREFRLGKKFTSVSLQKFTNYARTRNKALKTSWRQLVKDCRQLSGKAKKRLLYLLNFVSPSSRSLRKLIRNSCKYRKNEYIPRHKIEELIVATEIRKIQWLQPGQSPPRGGASS